MNVSSATRTNSEYSQHMSNLEHYLRLRFGISVVYEKGKDTGLYSDTRQVNKNDFIAIDSKKSREWQLYALLHESGHVLLRENHDEHESRFPLTEHKRNTIGKRVDVLREEVIAWERARYLATELRIPIHEMKWNKQRAARICSFIIPKSR